MGGTLGGAAGGARMCQAWVRWATGCTGIAGCGTNNLGACGLSLLVGFFTLGTGGCTLVDRRSSHLSFTLCWGEVSSLGVMYTDQLFSVSFRD